jgi:hypothetical protein
VLIDLERFHNGEEVEIERRGESQTASGEGVPLSPEPQGRRVGPAQMTSP